MPTERETQAIRVEYNCCCTVYEYAVRMPRTGSILHHTSLVDTAIMHTDLMHDRDHPECEE